MVYFSNFLNPAATSAMFHLQHLLLGPVKMVGNVGYLLVQLIEGVAYDPPRLARSTSNFLWQSGQVTGIRVMPSSLIWR